MPDQNETGADGDSGKTAKRLNSILAAVLISFVLLIYSNSFHGDFIFDDYMNIVDNLSIRDASQPLKVLKGSWNTGISGRPVANMSFALNHAISGLNTWSYHALNLIIHIISACFLFGIIRRTLISGGMSEDIKKSAPYIAFFGAILWAAHPLQTQSVTYITQRIESLMGCCFLATFYLAIRGWDAEGGNRIKWHSLAVLGFITGTGVKEVMIVAPPLILLYDMMFVHGNASQSIKQSKLLYSGLLFGTILLLLLVAHGGTALKGYAGASILHKPVAWHEFFLNQPHSIATYLKLAFWPGGLSIYYEWARVPLAFTLSFGAVIVAFILFSARALVRGKKLAYLSAWFFLILSPTTTVLPLWYDIEEHRMYLSLASLTVLVTLGVFAAGRKYALTPLGVFALISSAIALGLATYERNFDYASQETIWKDVMAKNPDYAGPRFFLAEGHHRKKEYKKAIAELEAGLLRYKDSGRYNQLGVIYDETGDYAQAEKCYRAALAQNPRDHNVMNNLGLVLVSQNKFAQAARMYDAAIRLSPREHRIYANMGVAVALMGSYRDALPWFLKSLALEERNASAHEKAAIALYNLGDRTAAIRHMKRAVELDPQNPSLRAKLRTIEITDPPKPRDSVGTPGA